MSFSKLFWRQFREWLSPVELQKLLVVLVSGSLSFAGKCLWVLFLPVVMLSCLVYGKGNVADICAFFTSPSVYFLLCHAF